MPLTPGIRLGVYDITAQIGEGGMGQVYRATDTKLKRQVAIKILPASLAVDHDRLARFQREAEVLASLNHPNIAAIYGLEECAGVTALVMELVEGDDLSQRIARGAISLDDALPIAKQIANALEAAHEQGVIHRDLKPANIKVRPDGTVKVLDFGLAKAMEPAAGSSPDNSMSPTLTTPAMTQAGMILGTAAYMSPEQAKGRLADKRSDVWAFGCVLFEMLTGTRAFEGEDVGDTLAAVLRGEPNWNALPANIPSAIRTLIERCLAKDRRRRAADISVAQFVLTDPGALAAPRDAPARVPAPPSRPRWKSAVPIAAAVLATATLVGAGAWTLRPSALAPPVARFSFTVPGVVATGPNVVAISPDGAEVAYAVNNRVFLRLLSEFDAHAIPGSESSSLVSSPTFSPDGRSIAFHVFGENLVKRIAVGGGAAVTICPATSPYGMAWDSAGDLLIGQAARGIFSCSTNGGAPRQLATVKDGEQAHGPQILPGGKALLFTIASAAGGAPRWDKAQVVVQTLASGARKTVVNGGSGARYLQTGHMFYTVDGVVFAVRFDPVKQAVLSEPVPVLEGVRRTPGVGGATLLLDTSATGTLLYIPGPTSTTTAERALALADRSGAVTRLAIPPGPYVHVRASRDGRRLAIGSDDGKEANVLIYEVAGSSAARRLTYGGRNLYPIWSPDGQRVAFQSDREGDIAIFSQRADGTSAPERLTKPDKGVDHVPESWSPDGKTLLFSEGKGTSYALEALSLADLKAAPSGAVRSAEPIGAVFSPDGRWVAYASAPLAGGVASANRGVYVQPFPSIGTAYQVPRQQLDFHPTWGPKGTELFYVPTAASGQLAAVSVTTRPGVTFGTPANLPARVMANRTSGETRAYDVLPDGKFVGVVSSSELDPLGAAAAPQIRVVLNWFDELKARVPTK